MIELAPKGTGKSYLFGNVSRFGWLSSGGVMSRAKMFYDQTKRKEGLIAGNDFVTLDEVQTISFTDTDEMRAALKDIWSRGILLSAIIKELLMQALFSAETSGRKSWMLTDIAICLRSFRWFSMSQL